MRYFYYYYLWWPLFELPSFIVGNERYLHKVSLVVLKWLKDDAPPCCLRRNGHIYMFTLILADVIQMSTSSANAAVLPQRTWESLLWRRCPLLAFCALAWLTLLSGEYRVWALKHWLLAEDSSDLRAFRLRLWKSSGVILIDKRKAVLRLALLFIHYGSTACHNGIDITTAASQAGRRTDRKWSHRIILPQHFTAHSCLDPNYILQVVEATKVTSVACCCVCSRLHRPHMLLLK